MITIKDIHRRVNIPTLLILPAYCNYIEPKPITFNNNLLAPLYMMMFKCGLKHCKIELDPKGIEIPDNLILTFNQNEAVKDRSVSTWIYDSMDTQLNDYDTLIYNWVYEDEIFYKFSIPAWMKEDIVHIIDNNYHKVSKKFKDLSITREEYIIAWPDNIGHFVLSKNLPIGILDNKKFVREMNEDFLGMTMPENVSPIRAFDPDLDTFMYLSTDTINLQL